LMVKLIILINGYILLLSTVCGETREEKKKKTS